MLFKRLLSHFKADTSEYNQINDLINKMEKKVSEINEIMRQFDSLARITFIEENLEFGNVFEVNKLKKLFHIYIYNKLKYIEIQTFKWKQRFD